MGNDIEIRVRVANNTATGLAAVNRSFNQLADNARQAGRGLDSLSERAGVAAVALRALRDSAQDASRSLRSLNTATRNADGRMSTMSDRSRTLRQDTDDLDTSMRRLGTTMGGLRGSNGRVNATFGNSSGAMEKLKAAAIALSPALIPIAAAAVPIVANVGAAGAAIGAFGLAIAGQLVAVKGASDAQQKYSDAVKKHGAASKEAGQAEALYLEQVQGMDPATRRAAAALSSLTDQYKVWSRSLAGDTMPVFTKGLAVAGALLPKLTPVVKGASAELDRFMTILAGGVNSGGFSAFMDSFAKFSTGALSKANDALVRFMRTMAGGAGHSQFTEFMTYVKNAGPQVAETLGNLSKALIHIVAAASDTGVGLLTVVNAVAKLVNAIPTGVLSTFLQLAFAFKAVKLASAGLAAVAGGWGRMATQLTALRAASTAAGGGLAGLRAAIGTLSRGAQIGIVVGGVTALVAALHALSDNKGAVEVDKLSTALNTLSSTGKVTGALKSNLTDISESIAMVSKGASDNKIAQLTSDFGTFVGISTGPGISDARKNVDAWDKSMANLVKAGHTKEAADQYSILRKAWVAGGGDLKRLNKFTDDYKAALADQKFEAKMTADSMGLFGEQAQKTATKLDAQKASADGLRQSIQALNDVNRQGLGGMIGFEQAIDDAAEAAKKNAGALSMSHGELNLSSQKARDAASALQDLADKTDSAAASARESGSSWETVNGIYSRGRSALIKNAEAMGLTKDQARQLASQILKIPDKTTKVKMNTEDAQAGLNAFNAALKRTPGAKSVTMKALTSSAEQALEALGYKVTHLKNGNVRVTAATGGALSGIRNVAGAVAALHGKNITITTNHVTKFTSVQKNGTTVAKRDYASGGRVRGYAGGGDVQGFPDGGYVQGPGSGTSDSILAFMGSGAVANVSNTEYVMKAAAVRKYGVKMMDALNNGQLPVAHLAKGGMSQAMKDARGQLSGGFGISSFGRMAGYQRTPFEKSLGAPSDVSSLVSALNQVAGQIKAAFSGHTESSLLKRLSSVGKSLISYEKQLNSVTKSLASAKDKLNSLKDASSQLASSVKGGILSSANITSGAADSTPTVASIMGGLTANRDKATAFADALKQLKAKGLSSSLIQQIGEAGISGGGLETAGALLGASSSEIRSLNSLQGQINSAAGAAGKTTADSVYAKAIKDQTAVVSKLTHQQEKLEKAMASLAKTMEKLISKALKGKASGGIVGAAASGGLRNGLTMVGEQGIELLDLPAGSRVWSNPDTRRKLASAQAPWSSMLNSPRRGPAYGSAQGPAGRQEPVVIELRSSGSEVDEMLLKILRRAIRVRGGNVNVVLTGRKG
ncbi:phage tail protein [Streptomyces sp. NPDC051016]|uniref:phage tail protein n=1 Tax=Streptomyces sp. NPDC051016 TaxID=3365638 RepID=UPI00378E50DC